MTTLLQFNYPVLFTAMTNLLIKVKNMSESTLKLVSDLLLPEILTNNWWILSYLVSYQTLPSIPGFKANHKTSSVAVSQMTTGGRFQGAKNKPLYILISKTLLLLSVQFLKSPWEGLFCIKMIFLNLFGVKMCAYLVDCFYWKVSEPNTAINFTFPCQIAKLRPPQSMCTPHFLRPHLGHVKCRG